MLVIDVTDCLRGERAHDMLSDYVVHVDSDAGKRLFLDFWKLPYQVGTGTEQAGVSILTGAELTSPREHALVLLRHEGEPRLCLLDENIYIYARVRPLKHVPEHLDVAATIKDLDGNLVSAVLRDPVRNVIYVPFFLDEVLSGFHQEKYIAGRRTFLPSPVSRTYYAVKGLIPSGVRAGARSYLTKAQKRRPFPRWPLETSLEDFKRLALRWLLQVSRTGELPFIWFWPRGKDFCLLLTHDVERSLEGNNGIDNLSSAERVLGFKSSLNVVPFRYPVTSADIQALKAEGFEIGVHGYSHDGMLFQSWQAFKDRAGEINRLARSWGAVGFRSASTYRNPYWLNMIDFDYDSSFFDTDPYEPQPGGCLSLFPYLVGDTVELPLTMPQDYTLFVLLKEANIKVWLTKAQEIRDRNGLICLVAHPDEGYVGDADKVRHYVEFLEFLDGDDRMWNPYPREAARWWRARDAARLVNSEGSLSINDGRPDMALCRARLSEGALVLDVLE